MSYGHVVSAATIAFSTMLFCVGVVAQSGTTPSASQTLKPPEGTNEPVPTRPDPDGGENKAALFVQRDLALIGEFRLGSVDIPWGTAAIVSAQSAVSKSGGKCSFRFRYATKNIGGIVSLPTQNRIRLQTQNGPLLSSVALPGLIPNAAAQSNGQIALAPGTWMLYVHADATAANAELDESNNLRRVRVTVNGDCG
jgi:hypothetical protein